MTGPRVRYLRGTRLRHEHPQVARGRGILVPYRDGAKREELAAQVYSTLEKTYGPDHPWTAAALLTWSSWTRVMAGYEDAEAKARQALTVLEAVYGHHHPLVALAYEIIAIPVLHMGQFADGLVFLKKAEAILMTRAVPNIRLITVMDYLFMCYTEAMFFIDDQ